MKNVESATRRRRGRPLSFDREAALEQAMLVFWRYGYEATSLSDLTAAMGVTPPSLYAAFGDKKGLFREAARRYLSGPVTAQEIIDRAASAREAAEALLAGSAVKFTGKATPPGCLLASATISCSAAAADLQGELSAVRHDIERHLHDKIVDDVRAERLPAGTDAEGLAGHVMATIQGLSTLARDGASRDKLSRIAAVAMTAWPTGA